MEPIQVIDLTERKRKWGGEVFPLTVFALGLVFILQWETLFALPARGLTLDTLREIGLLIMLLSIGTAAIIRAVLPPGSRN